MSSVSYANAVANGSKSDQVPEKQDQKQDHPVDNQQLNDEKQNEPKKSLAPAPVPKSVWGEVSDSFSNLSVDEKKWPTPDKQVEEQQSAKFVKQSHTTKWVPINAKVTLQTSKPSQPRRSRKSKPATKKQPPKKKEEEVEKKSPPPKEEVVKTEQPEASKPARRFNNGKRFNQFYQPQPYPRYRQKGPTSSSPKPYRFNNNRQIPMFIPYPLQQQQQHLIQHQQQPIPIQIPPPISPKQDPQQALIQQIDYYFSLENLIKDLYLRKNMDSQGWVPLDLILQFKRIKIIINGLMNSLENGNEEEIILESIKQCNNLDISYGETFHDVKLKVKHNFQQWLLPDM